MRTLHAWEKGCATIAMLDALTTFGATTLASTVLLPCRLTGRVADELAKDKAAMQRLRDRPDTTVMRSDVAPLVAAAIDGMASRAILYIDAARPQWQATHATSMLAEVGFS